MEVIDKDPKWGYAVLLWMAVLIAVLLLGMSCRTVKKSQDILTERSNNTSIVDTLHVSKYDTTTTTHELINYQTKVVELYDTVRTVKDSIITRLVSRTIFTNGSQDKTVTKIGTGSDSIVGKKETSQQTEKTDKKYYKDVSSFPWWLIAIVGLAGVFIWWMIKKWLP
jgi:hypothetical protein